MISTEKLLYRIDMMLNKVASLEHQNIPKEDKILALNEAQIKLIKSKVDINNLFGIGADGFKKRYQDLQNLIVSFEELSVTADTSAYPAWQANLITTTSKYMFPLDAYVLATKDSCVDRVISVAKPVKHGDLSTWMNNTHYVPSFEYQETFCAISANKYIVYTDGTFVINKLYLSYLRYPTKIDIAGYIDFDGTASTTVNCELEDYLEDELLRFTCLELGMDTENVPVVQFDQIRNKTNE